MLMAMGVYGGVALLTLDKRGPIGRGLCLSFASLCAAALIQLVPLPAGVVGLLSPTTAIHAEGLAAASAFRPLSIDPEATSVGLVCVLSLGLFFAGAMRHMTDGNARGVAGGLIGLGSIVAGVGIAESSRLWTGVYEVMGLPLPPDSTPLGPFSSKNHYVAWMLMTLALALGYLCDILEHRASPRHTDEASSAEAGPQITRIALVLSAVVAMAVSLVQTRSRAGILGLGLAVVTMSILLLRRSQTTRAGLLLAIPLLLLPLTGIAITGLQPIVSRFDTDSWSTMHGRLPLWNQALVIARDFPIAGSGLNTYQRVVASYPMPGIDEPYEGAHNDYLQLGAEGGFLIGIPALVTLAFFGRETRKRFHHSSEGGMTGWLRIGAVLGIVLVALQETVEFGLQVPANAALFVVLAAIAAHHGSANS